MRKLFVSLTLALISVAASAQTVRLHTSMGDIRVQLNAEKAPKTVANFVAYTKAGHYDGTIFHRVIESFMIQGGGYTLNLQQKPTKAPIQLESRNGLSNVRGSLAMARSGDPHSATAQFFINVVDNTRLDADNAPDGQGYAVFGQVIEGMDVVDKIRAVPVAPRGTHQHAPEYPVVILKATLETQK